MTAALKWNSKLGVAAAAALFFAGSPAAARDDAQLWPGVNATVKLGEHWRLSQEVIARFSDKRNGLYEIESNTLLGYRVSPNVTLWAGYTHDPLYNGGHFTVMEHRAREQVTADNVLKLGRARVSARLRLEQRWREGVDGTAWRLRPYAKLTLPFRRSGKTALVASHESFIDLNKTPFQRIGGEERMRNLLAVTTPLAKNVSLEAGYLHQHGFVPSGDDTNDHAASLTLSFNF